MTPMKQPGKYGRKIALTILAVIVIAALVVLDQQALSNRSCVIGYSGSAANITFSSHALIPGETTATDICNSMVTNRYPGVMYHMDGPQGAELGVELCSGDYDGVTYTVRDAGMFNIIGYRLCKFFGQTQQQNGG